ncbi:hypothetical protein [Methanobrevibacter sp.]
MSKKHVTLMITSTFYDMFGEYYYFIKEVFPYLKEFCAQHDIILDYKDVAFSILADYSDNSIILDDFESIDADRTFFICFRGHKLGWKPNYTNVDKVTIDEYPELVKYVGNVSITELSIMHALVPFDKYRENHLEKLNPVKNALFYLRDFDFFNQLSETQKMFYTNMDDVDNREVHNMEIAKAKDLLFEIKRDFNKFEEYNMEIRYYHGHWNEQLDMHDIFMEYCEEYSQLNDTPLEDFIETHEINMCYDYKGCLDDFVCEGKPFKEILINDILNGLKEEFPENFN